MRASPSGTLSHRQCPNQTGRSKTLVIASTTTRWGWENEGGANSFWLPVGYTSGGVI